MLPKQLNSLLVLVFGIAYGLSLVHGGDRASRDNWRGFDGKDLSKLLSQAGLSKAYIRSASRNSTGTKVFVECAGSSNNTTIVATISPTGVRTQTSPGISPVFNNEGELVCSLIEQALVFGNGTKVKLVWNTRFGFSPGGRFFYLYRPKGEGASVFSVADPGKVLTVLDKDFSPHAIFDDAKTVYVFGSSASDRSKGAIGIVLLTDGGEVRVQPGFDFSWAGAVRDMDVQNGLILLEGKRDMLASWTIYDIKSQERMRFGLAHEYGLFLHPSIQSLFKR